MSEKRKTYDKEFKLSAVKMITEEGMSVRRVSRDLGVNENSLHKWKKDYLSDRENAFPGKGRMKPEDEEIRKLKKELSRVTMERDIFKKSHSILRKGKGVKYMFIKENRKKYPIGLMCKILSVSRSGYHHWLKRKLSGRYQEDKRILEIIRFHYNRSNGTYGLPRITAAIRKEGLKVNKKRIARLMKANNIRAKTKRRFKITTKQNSKAKASENIVNQNFRATIKNQLWTSDITYLWTKEGWLYLTVVMDVYSRKIIGWSIDERLSAELVIRALMMAIVHRNPAEGVIFHSDRGSQYSSSNFRSLLKSYRIVQSMSSTGNCYDNAITESFFHTLKIELIYWENYHTREEAKRSIFQYIEINYNRRRLHSALGYLTPVEFEEKNCEEVIEKVA
ncbi:MAG: IS3 family transposase [bacterium]